MGGGGALLWESVKTYWRSHRDPASLWKKGKVQFCSALSIQMWRMVFWLLIHFTREMKLWWCLAQSQHLKPINQRFILCLIIIQELEIPRTHDSDLFSPSRRPPQHDVRLTADWWSEDIYWTWSHHLDQLLFPPAAPVSSYSLSPQWPVVVDVFFTLCTKLPLSSMQEFPIQ